MVTAQLICAFVLVYAKGRFSHDTAHISLLKIYICLLQSDSEYEVSSPVRRRRRPRRSTVRFADDMNRELHDLHHKVRDLSSDHLNLETSFNREVERRDG